jgi:hypothetical protein
MRRKWLTVACALSLTAALSAAAPGAAAPKAALDSDDGRASLRVFVGELTPQQVETLRGMGVDDLAASAGAGGRVNVEVILSAPQAERLRSRGVALTEKKVRGQNAADALRTQAAAGQTVFRTYSEPGGIRDELVSAAAAHPGIAKLVTVGRSLNGQQILAVKVTKNARFTKDGSRPSVMYLGTQHAREWITPEMVRRLMHEVLDGYGTDPTWTSLVNTRELWFLPVANPDGYDFTFTEGNRLWRKNLRDVDGNGQTTIVDGVDLNRNFPTRWGMDNEGSSPDPSSETYRGAGPASEPETRALDALFRRVGFTFLVNYHSAASLLLYGVGWQVSTPTPDDEIYKALAGDDANPAVPGYDPDISAELYTTNGDTDTHMTARYHTLGFTPEMSTCQTAANSDPNDEWVAADCASGFIFPDDEALIRAEFVKNIPFARSVAQSAANPSEPVSSVGLTAPDLVPDVFELSYGRDQAVAVTAKRSLKDLRLRYSVNGGRSRSVGTKEWRGGERYGDTDDHYYGEFRGTVRDTRPGDSVEVWFTARKKSGGSVSSAPFTYTVHTDIGAKVLILAVEDVTGISPVQGVTESQYVDEYAASLAAAGYSTDVYDFDAHGRRAPHPLGVLSHYRAVVWETGNDIILRSTGQVAGTTAKAALDTELAVRDYLNEGGKVLVAGQNALFAQGADGAYHYNPFAPPECTTPNVYPCLPILNDFQQYYLGSYVYLSDAGFDDNGDPFPLSGTTGRFAGFAGELNAAGSAGNQTHTAGFLATSSLLPPADFPTFNTSSTPVDWVRPVAGPYNPHTGSWHVFSGQAELSYKRLTRTIDLSSASAASLEFFTSYDTEADWDFLFVEAHTVGQDNWTTLADTDSDVNTSTETGDSCASGWHDIHPFLAHYQTFDPAAETCTPSGSSGTWNAASGNSGGWQHWAVDLSGFTGDQVEVSISYVSDWFFQGLGVFVDDATVTVDGTTTSTSFESGLDGWTVAGPAPGSAPGATDWERTQRVIDEGAVTVTKDTVYTGFGLEGLAPATRDDFVKRAMRHLLG